MNQPQPYMDVHSSHVSSAQQYGSLPAPGGSSSNMGSYQQGMMQHQGSYPSTPASYPTYNYANGVISPQSGPQHQSTALAPSMQSAMLPHLPGKVSCKYSIQTQADG